MNKDWHTFILVVMSTINTMQQYTCNPDFEFRKAVADITGAQLQIMSRATLVEHEIDCDLC